MSQHLEALIIRHTHRVPVGSPVGAADGAGAGAAAARQLDVALMAVGFKLAGDLLERLSGLSDEAVVAVAGGVLATAREMVGDHVQHNAYFIDFPANVPDTVDFWAECIAKALADDATREGTLAQLSAGVVNLLTLPTYGRYQHTYAELLAAHGELIAAAGDRLTVLHLGGTFDDEVTALYLALAGSATPLGEGGLRDLRELGELCALGPQPESIPVRENRAVINAARIGVGVEVLVDTVTDVLRLACSLSGGDVSLTEPTKFGPMKRSVRRALLAGLDRVVAEAPTKLADVGVHREQFKRLGERLHPHEYPQWPHAAEVFAVARGEKRVRSFGSRVEELLGAGDVVGAARLLTGAPGRLFRGLDRLLRACGTQDERDAVVGMASEVAPQVSGRVLLSLREHFQNRGVVSEAGSESGEVPPEGMRRVFVNSSGGAWVAADSRDVVPGADRERLIAVLDAEIRRRLPAPGRLLVDPDVLDVALPLSGKASAAGFGVLPRGSVSRVDGELLRFFVFWQQTASSTDYDLSALMLDAEYETLGWLSYTELTAVEGEHSGDITDAPAPDGASEFINLRLGAARGSFIVPQVNIYSGENFQTVAESFFGFMVRDAEQEGRPFEARTVRMKSDLRGPGRVALPVAFQRGEDGSWRAKWLHVYLRGTPSANRVEENQVSVALLLRGVVEREYLTVRYLLGLMGDGLGSGDAVLWDGVSVPEGPVTYVGVERPEGLHPESVVVTLGNLRDLIPE